MKLQLWAPPRLSIEDAMLYQPRPKDRAARPRGPQQLCCLGWEIGPTAWVDGQKCTGSAVSAAHGCWIGKSPVQHLQRSLDPFSTATQDLLPGLLSVVPQGTCLLDPPIPMLAERPKLLFQQPREPCRDTKPSGKTIRLLH